MNSLNSPSKVLEHVSLSYIQANGIQHRIATAGWSKQQQGMLVMLLHGWPESWYSWRHQLVALSKEGYCVCAPDMRGYGGTDSPKEVSQYDIHVLVQDVMDIASHIIGSNNSPSSFVVVGHDFGAYLAWHVALLHPSHIRGVCGMSVPYMGHTTQPPLQRYRTLYHHNHHKNAKFHYMLYHCLPNADIEYHKHTKETLYRLLGSSKHLKKKDIEPGTPEITNPQMFPNNNKEWDAKWAPGLWYRLPRPKSLPSWLTDDDFQYIVSQYQQSSSSSFTGGLKWYQALDDNWKRTSYLKQHVVLPPTLFLAGEEDDVICAHGGKQRIIQSMKQQHNNTQCVFFKGCGHWIQQEIPNQINTQLIQFLTSLSNQTTHSRL